MSIAALKIIEPGGSSIAAVQVNIPGLQGPAGTGGETAYPVVIAAVGQTQIPLTIPPAILSQVAAIVNGVEYRAPFISASSIAVTWSGPFDLEPSDSVFVRY